MRSSPRRRRMRSQVVRTLMRAGVVRVDLADQNTSSRRIAAGKAPRRALGSPLPRRRLAAHLGAVSITQMDLQREAQRHCHLARPLLFRPSPPRCRGRRAGVPSETDAARQELSTRYRCQPPRNVIHDAAPDHRPARPQPHPVEEGRHALADGEARLRIARYRPDGQQYLRAFGDTRCTTDSSLPTATAACRCVGFGEGGRVDATRSGRGNVSERFYGCFPLAARQAGSVACRPFLRANAGGFKSTAPSTARAAHDLQPLRTLQRRPGYRAEREAEAAPLRCCHHLVP